VPSPSSPERPRSRRPAVLPPEPPKRPCARRGEGELDDAARKVSSTHARASEQARLAAVVTAAWLDRRRRSRPADAGKSVGEEEMKIGFGPSASLFRPWKVWTTRFDPSAVSTRMEMGSEVYHAEFVKWAPTHVMLALPCI
jgi:hypothetical protein